MYAGPEGAIQNFLVKSKHLEPMQHPQQPAVDMLGSVVSLTSSKAGPVISWPGYGIMFFWQLGVLQYLEQMYDLSEVTMVGSSAGSMLSVFAACDVQGQSALDLAHELCVKHGVFNRPLGLLGVWGNIVREWLDTLLPPDAADRCCGRVRIVITTLPLFHREVVTSFKHRADLIDCCLASSHVPFLLDWRASALCRGRQCVDGSMLYILTGRCHGLKPALQSGSLLLFDPFSDKQLMSGFNILRCVLLCGKEGAQQLLEQGYAYAKTLEASGALSALGPYRRPQVPQGIDTGLHIGDMASSNSSSQATTLASPGSESGHYGAGFEGGSNGQAGMRKQPAAMTGALPCIERDSAASMCSSGSNVSLVDLHAKSLAMPGTC